MLLPQLQDVTSTSSSWWLRGFLLELLGDEAFRRRGELEPQAIALLVNAHARLQMSIPLLFELFLHQTCLRFLEWTSIPCSFETLCLVISEGSRLVFTLRLSRTWFSKIQGLFCTRYSAPDSCSQSSISLSHLECFRQITKKWWNIICSLAHSWKLP